MSAAVWDAEKGGRASGEEAAATAAAQAAAAAEAVAAAEAAGTWDPASQSGAGFDSGAGGSSSYPETKDNGTDAAADLFGNDLPPQSEQARTQQGDPAMVIASIAPQHVSNGGGGGGFGTIGTNGTAFPSGSTMVAKRRNSMAFEIARMEREGRTAPPANPQKAQRVWELSRPRYVEEGSEHGPSSSGGRGGTRRVRVPPGQENRSAVPYGVWSTSWAQMGDFGLDVGMYFVTLAQLVGAVLVYAALCVVAMVHFSSEQYSGQQVSPTCARYSVSVLLFVCHGSCKA